MAKPKRRKTGVSPEDRLARKFYLQERMLRLAPVGLAAALVLMIIAIVLSIGATLQIRDIQRNSDAIDKAQVELHVAQIRVERAEARACARVQGLRDQLNFTNGVIYRVLQAAARSNSSVSKRYNQIISAVPYLRPTDCFKAVMEPDTYVPPDPIPFREYLRQQEKRDHR